jgi:subtilisin family serine protease
MSFRAPKGSAALLAAISLLAAGASPRGLAAQSPDAGRSPDLAVDTAPAEYVPGEVLVAFSPGARGHADAARAALGAAEVKEFAQIGVRHWKLPPGLDVERAVQVLSRNPNVLFAEPNYVGTVDTAPNDPLRGDLYGLHNLGQTGGTADADVDALEAWETTTGSPEVVVAVIDTGTDLTHPDLAANAWTNPLEVAGNGVDDDGNGYVDDTCGWDFVNDDNDPSDDHYHGTHTAGTVAADDNGVGVVGVAPDVKVVPIKWIAADGNGTTDDAIAAVLYAATLRDAAGNPTVRITSNSWRIPKRSSALQSAIETSGALFVASAGNNNSSSTQYPAGYSSANILSVAATDHNDARATFSNYSSSWVDLGAPGVNVLSCSPGSGYRVLSGTSMAAPHVAGAAALLLSQSPGLSISALKSALMDTVDVIASMQGITVTGGRLNVRRAVGAAELPSDAAAPDAVVDFSATPSATTDAAAEISWTATGDDGVSGSAYCYDLRYATAPISEATFAAATAAAGEPLPAAGGSPESFTLSGLSPNTAYHVALRVYDESGNAGPLATATVTTLPLAWSTEVVEGNDAGFYKWLAFSPDGHPAIAYSASNSALKLATWTGASWSFETIESGRRSSNTGVCLAYDLNGNPTVSYGWGKLTFARRIGSSWVRTVVEASNAYNDMTSLVYDASGQAAIAYAGNGNLKLARETASGWTTEVVDPVASAKYKSLAFDPATGEPVIAYSDVIGGGSFLNTLKVARKVGGSWQIEVLATGVTGYGVFASLAFDPVDGNPSIVHRTDPGVSFLHWNGSSWDVEYVADGSNCSLSYGPDGAAHVTFSTGTHVLFARRDAPGTWTSQTVDVLRSTWISPTAFGPDGRPAIAYRDQTARTLKFARRSF